MHDCNNIIINALIGHCNMSAAALMARLWGGWPLMRMRFVLSHDGRPTAHAHFSLARPHFLSSGSLSSAERDVSPGISHSSLDNRGGIYVFWR